MARSGRKSKNLATKESAPHDESYKSVIVGFITIVVVLFLSIVIFNLLRSAIRTDKPQITATNTKLELSEEEIYVVEQGESLNSIAYDLYGDYNRVKELARLNNIKDPNKITAGMELKIPVEEDEVMDGQGNKIIPTAVPTDYSQPTSVPTAMVTPTVATANTVGPSVVPTQEMSDMKPVGQKTYTIVWGDTLWDIAQRTYGDPLRYHEIAEINGISNPDLIYAGSSIVLP